ncbi:MAG: pseudouridine synthase [Alloprevotella sp.]|nr:pseudouridine synthase [Alloprevotella sp.]
MTNEFDKNETPQRGFEGGEEQFPKRENPMGRTPRPRFSRPGGGYNPRPSYGDNRPRYSRDDNDGGEYRPPRQFQPRPRYGENEGYRPRYNREGGEGGYQPRPYQPRPRYGENEGYRPRYNREGGEGGYQPRPYQPRPRYGEGGGYQPRYNRYGQGGEGFDRNRTRKPYNPKAKYTAKKRYEYKETELDPTKPIRLNKFLANAGICSRRDADKYIQAGVITVNGEVVTELGTRVLRSDNIMFHDQPVRLEKKVYVLLNKPKGYVTTSDDPQNRKTVLDLVKNACRERIYPVGRLDRSTTGVLLLTNDGELATVLTSPAHKKKKIYQVTLDRNVVAADLRQITEGIQLEDGVMRADEVHVSEDDHKKVGIEIHSGRNRIVRRIFEHLGYKVVKLDRVFFAGLTKKNLKRGDWRHLTPEEVNFLRAGLYE